MTTLAIIVVVDKSARRNWPEHGSYDDGYISTHSEHASMDDARRAMQSLTPLHEPLTYEVMHKLTR